MKKIIKYLGVLTVVLAVFSSCLEGDGSYKTRTFWALDVTKDSSKKDSYYQLTAELMASNSRCEIWVEKGSGVSESTAKQIASEYSSKIYLKMMNALGWEARYSDGTKTDTMDHVDVDRNGKLIILLLDIRDGYSGGGYVGGFFHSLHLFANYDSEKKPLLGNLTGVSNECDMIFMDINPGVAGDEKFYGILAHEMQHLMNFSSSLAFRTEGNTIYLMDTWIDEGLAEASYWIYSGKQDESRVGWYNADPTGYIAKGDNFYLWDNYNDKDQPDTVLNDYATTYLFFQWLRLSTDDEIYGDIIKSEHYNYKAIDSLLVANWTEIIETWHGANFYNHPSTISGYKNDSVLKIVQASFLKEETATIPLYPGEAVYSYSSTTITKPADEPYVSYQELGGVKFGNTEGFALLTYNTDFDFKNLDGNKQILAADGTVTGEKPPVSASIQPSVSVSRHVSNRAYNIGAGDIQRRLGFGQNEFEPVVLNNNQTSTGSRSLNSAPLPAMPQLIIERENKPLYELR